MATPMTRRICVHESRHYVKYRLVEDGAGAAACRDEIRRRAENYPPLLGWVARARLLAAVPR